MSNEARDGGKPGWVAQPPKNPFAEFMAMRPLPAQKRWPAGIRVAELPRAPPSQVPDAGKHPFASFLNSRPPPPAPPTTTEQLLREDILRAKKQLLEVAVKAEQRALEEASHSGGGSVDKAALRARRRRTKIAERYLRNPELIDEAMSDFSDEEPSAASSVAPSVPRSTLQRSDSMQSRQGRAPSMASSASAPNLARAGSAAVASASLSDFRAGEALPTIEGSRPVSPQAEPGSALNEPLLTTWYDRCRSWNAAIMESKSGGPRMRAKRQIPQMPGGCVILGNGRIPLINARHLVTTGYYFTFEIESVDNKNHPLTSKNTMSFGFGVSRVPPSKRMQEKATYAYELPQSVLLGYGAHLIDSGKWLTSPWDPKSLQKKDMVGVLITIEGDMVVFVNNEQVVRVATSLALDGEAQADADGVRRHPPRALFPVVDLHGRVSSVVLHCNTQPPNEPLKARVRTQLDVLPSSEAKLKA